MKDDVVISLSLLHILLRQNVATVSRLIGEIRMIFVLWLLTEVFDRINGIISYFAPR